MVDVNNIVVIGAGIMGVGIAQMSLMAGYNVTLVDIKDEYINNGVAKIEEGMKKLEAKGKLEEGATAADVMGRLKTSLDLAAAVKDADFVVEAVIEKMDIKKQVFKTCADNAPAHAILATNTSTMSITEIAKDCGRPENCIGMHFFNPVPLIRLIEIIPGEKSSDDAIDTAIAVGKKLPCLAGERFVVKILRDRPGFIVNRMNAPGLIYLSWIIDQAAEKGIPWEQIDGDAASLMLLPPCELLDHIGIDTVKHAMEYYAETLSPDFKPGKVILEMNEKGTLGAKTGQGFYTWPEGGKPNIDKSQKAGLFDPLIMVAILLNEGCRVLEEKVVICSKTIDDTYMAGMNAPGPFGMGRRKWEEWSEVLEELADKTGKEYLRPCELMKTGGFLKMRR